MIINLIETDPSDANASAQVKAAWAQAANMMASMFIDNITININITYGVTNEEATRWGLPCGGTLQPGTLGVANKTLPCGTEVKLRYHGRSVTVPVVDRGPYVAGRAFDLTAATKARLGFPDVGVLLSSR